MPDAPEVARNELKALATCSVSDRYWLASSSLQTLVAPSRHHQHTHPAPDTTRGALHALSRPPRASMSSGWFAPKYDGSALKANLKMGVTRAAIMMKKKDNTIALKSREILALLRKARAAEGGASDPDVEKAYILVGVRRIQRVM